MRRHKRIHAAKENQLLRRCRMEIDKNVEILRLTGQQEQP